MDDLQVENGHTRIANGILEAVTRARFNATQLKIVLVVWRYTYGYQRKEHELSVNFMAKKTGISTRNIKTETQNLIDYKVLKETQTPSFNRTRKVQFNKYHQEWDARVLTPDDLEPEEEVPPGEEYAPGEPHAPGEADAPGEPEFTRGTPEHQEQGTSPGEPDFTSPGEPDFTRGGEPEFTQGNKELKEKPKENTSTDDASDPKGQPEGTPVPLEPLSLELLMARYTQEQQATIIDYWKAIRQTRNSGKIARSVVQNTMDKWTPYSPDQVMEALQMHLAKYRGKREDYTMGIMRRIKRETGNEGNQHGTTGGYSDQNPGRPGAQEEGSLDNRFQFKLPGDETRAEV